MFKNKIFFKKKIDPIKETKMMLIPPDNAEVS